MLFVIFWVLVFRLSGFCFISLRGLGDGILEVAVLFSFFAFQGGFIVGCFCSCLFAVLMVFYGRVSLAVLSP